MNHKEYNKKVRELLEKTIKTNFVNDEVVYLNCGDYSWNTILEVYRDEISEHIQRNQNPDDPEAPIKIRYYNFKGIGKVKVLREKDISTKIVVLTQGNSNKEIVLDLSEENFSD